MLPTGSGYLVTVYVRADSDAADIKKLKRLKSQGAEIDLLYDGEGERRFAMLRGYIDGTLLAPTALRKEVSPIRLAEGMATNHLS